MQGGTSYQRRALRCLMFFSFVATLIIHTFTMQGKAWAIIVVNGVIWECNGGGLISPMVDHSQVCAIGEGAEVMGAGPVQRTHMALGGIDNQDPTNNNIQHTR